MIRIETDCSATDSLVRLFEEMYDPALIIDPVHGNIVGANAAACQFLGYSQEEFAALSPAEIHPHEIPRLDAFLFNVQKQGRWIADDLSCRAKNGGLLPAQVRASLVRIGDHPYVLAIIHDRRDAELAELGRSIRKLTHDLRNTMVSSRLMSDRLRRHDDPRVRQSAEIIARSIDRAVRMCQQTLTIGSARENKPRRERFMLKDLITELHVAIGPEEVAGVHLEAVESDSFELEADFDQIFRVLMNLIRNAISAGSTCISIHATGDDQISVIDCRDDGPGLSESVQACLFSEKPVSDSVGAGLGLSIAWELARNHGGDLTLLSTGPKGTAFRLVLPSRSNDPEEFAPDGDRSPHGRASP